jgi:hypothetical protein
VTELRKTHVTAKKEHKEILRTTEKPLVFMFRKCKNNRYVNTKNLDCQIPQKTEATLKPNNPQQKYKGKGKAIPLQAWTGPEGSRRLRLPDFKTIDT